MRSLSDNISVLKGIGPKKQVAFNKLGINTIGDLLFYFPFRYEDLNIKQFENLSDATDVTLKGQIASQPIIQHFGRGKARLSFKMLLPNQHLINVTFFNQSYLQKQLTMGKEVAVYGKYQADRQSLNGKRLLRIKELNDFAGVYRASKELPLPLIKKTIAQAFSEYQDVIANLLPQAIQQKYQLDSRQKALHDMHFPQDRLDVKRAKQYLSFEEFFLFQLKVQLLKQKDKQTNGLVIKYDNQVLKEFIRHLPFELTKAQKRVVNQICHDLHSPIHMNRLLQGDVGSGKTIVAALAMYAAKTAGMQAALMVPTEILAQQHAEKLAKLFADFDVNIALLTSTTSKKAKQKNALLANLVSGEIDFLIGTHALIQDPVIFNNLGLIVIDEQHRFGVKQRQKLRKKGENPDVLAMTATPIPRTLAITSYGEMDISIIDELPAGRQPIQTILFTKKQQGQLLDFVERHLAQGEQAYVVSPLIAESEALDLQNAEKLYQQLQQYYDGQYRVGLLHGKLTPGEKEAIMEQFKQHEIDLLVSTTVIEVGVDVPNATIMVIFDADRFGLAQLHQLRGRVGRGNQHSYCLLVAEPKGEYGKARMQTMLDTTDGFVIAQQDLVLRGPGDVLGKKQAGVPEFKVGDPIKDLKLLQLAQQEANLLLQDDQFLTDPTNQPLFAYLQSVDVLRDELD